MVVPSPLGGCLGDDLGPRWLRWTRTMRDGRAADSRVGCRVVWQGEGGFVVLAFGAGWRGGGGGAGARELRNAGAADCPVSVRGGAGAFAEGCGGAVAWAAGVGCAWW